MTGLDYFARQAHAHRNRPGLTIDDGRFIDSWESNARKAEVSRMKAWASDQQRGVNDKITDALDRLNTIEDAHVRLRKAAENNEIEWQDLAKELRRLDADRLRVEQVYRSLQSSQDRIDTILADPMAASDAFFTKFTVLADRRPDLASALEDDRLRRGIRLA